jgi:hypothetical protein
MVYAFVNETQLILRLHGFSQLWPQRGRLAIPLNHVHSVRLDPKAYWDSRKALRIGGTDLPGGMLAGTLTKNGKNILIDAQDPDNTIVIDLVDELLDQLVVDVDNPLSVVGLIQEAASAPIAA